jgi:hypothetical protein
MRPIDDMDALQTIVAAALAVKSSAAMPKKTHCEARLETLRLDITFSLRGNVTHDLAWRWSYSS